MKEANTMEASKSTKDAYKRLQTMCEQQYKDDYYYEPIYKSNKRTGWDSFTHFLFIRQTEVIAVMNGFSLGLIIIMAVQVAPVIIKTM